MTTTMPELPEAVLTALAPAVDAIRTEVRAAVKAVERARIEPVGVRHASQHGDGGYRLGLINIIRIVFGDQPAASERVSEPIRSNTDRDCQCNSCTDTECDGTCETCDDYECEQCHSTQSCCGYCDRCDTHHDVDTSSQCSQCNRCSECEHTCDW